MRHVPHLVKKVATRERVDCGRESSFARIDYLSHRTRLSLSRKGGDLMKAANFKNRATRTMKKRVDDVTGSQTEKGKRRIGWNRSR